MNESNGNMSGKICLVTGATSGIGEVTALELARQGATVIVVGRSIERGTATVKRITKATGSESVDFMQADLSLQAEVRQLADCVQERYSHLDVLVNNAGAVFWRRKETAEQLEMTFALNHLNYFLLTNLLLDMLKASTPARIINVASDAHKKRALDFDDLLSERRYIGWRAYGRSKLANILFTYELARRLEGTGITANVMHPGVVATRFGGSAREWFKIGSLRTGRTPEKGAETIIYLATSPEVEGVTGKYFVDNKQAKSSARSYDETAAKRLWEVSTEMTLNGA